ncbi:response regulator transcription factor [Campylobacter fetus]|uniref:response regulator transcription factor n=1 Tax=Campylobacter fetus TaxID=196 RepID=UPI0003C26A10|nr:response regulator transcription factor [Campylobacter fetus]AGZ81424.1 two-component system response regulator [Campylobacter fetus subsp. testudinum 03-427]ALV64523.1 two-component system response regulator [Campylobacter fetus subsp. testudinum Sp3]AVK80845.1 DNA-binding response regulator [Campylobacter fetus subsp. testudinum]EAI4322509.1 response regulator transcription factor [Campylobacter fetus]EAI4391919.1 response regulator transcription factor [Campylobacter fetus]
MNQNISANIIVIDDEIDLCELLEYNLNKAGFNVTTFLDTKRVEQFLDEEDTDLLIVDRNLNGVEGSKFVASLRAKGYNEPVIFLTAKSSNKDKLDGFDSGADDYITKPFEINELIARINALLKRSNKTASIYKFKNIILNLKTNEVKVSGETKELTKLEFCLLYEFMKNRNILLTRDYFLEEIWKENANDKTINIAIKRLRSKLGDAGEYIKSVRGEGYKLC